MSDVKVVSEKPVESPVPTEILEASPKEAPGVDTELTSSEALRKSIEEKAFEENNVEAPKVEEVVEEVIPEQPQKTEDVSLKIKERIQKRIDKEVAKRKTLEEQLAETQAELAALKNNVEKPKDTSDKKAEPTDAEIMVALKKAREEGDVEFELQIIDYKTKREANRIADERIAKIQEEEKRKQEATQRQLSDWSNLQKDYSVYDDNGKVDMSHPLNLANQNGLLYKTALSLYQDPELKKDFYSDSDQITGFRRAVADAHKELLMQGIYKSKPKEVIEVTPKKEKKPIQVLADPDASGSEDTTPSVPNDMSDTEKVRLEIKNRRKNLYSR
jgi:hypothetical protein